MTRVIRGTGAYLPPAIRVGPIAFFQVLGCVLALARIRRLVVTIEAIAKYDLILLCELLVAL